MRMADEAELATLAVAPEQRGRGIGGELLDRLLRAALDMGVRSVFLEVRASNEGAIALYRVRGYRHVGVRRQYYDRPPEDALVLRLRLPSASEPDEGT
jgi:ribosomal-protein-alanine N-acetyltransferase